MTNAVKPPLGLTQDDVGKMVDAACAEVDRTSRVNYRPRVAQQIAEAAARKVNATKRVAQTGDPETLPDLNDEITVTPSEVKVAIDRETSTFAVIAPSDPVHGGGGGTVGRFTFYLDALIFAQAKREAVMNRLLDVAPVTVTANLADVHDSEPSDPTGKVAPMLHRAEMNVAARFEGSNPDGRLESAMKRLAQAGVRRGDSETSETSAVIDLCLADLESAFGCKVDAETETVTFPIWGNPYR